MFKHQNISTVLIMILFTQIMSIRINGKSVNARCPYIAFQLQNVLVKSRTSTSCSAARICYKSIVGEKMPITSGKRIIHHHPWKDRTCTHNLSSTTARKATNNHFDQEKEMIRPNYNKMKASVPIISLLEIQQRLSVPSNINNTSNTDNKILDSNNNIYNNPTNPSIYDILQAAIRLLDEYNIPEPIISSCHLLSFALQDDFQWEDNGFSTLHSILQESPPPFSSHFPIRDKIITNQELQHFSSMIQRRLHKEPLQYIIGQWDFHDITLKIRKPCLCPRPETEELVEYVAKDIRKLLLEKRNHNKTEKKVRVLDVGCGTGAISLALANVFANEDDVEFVAIDISQEAIELTKENSISILGYDANDNTSKKYQVILTSATDFTNESKDAHKSKIVNISKNNDDNDHEFKTNDDLYQFEFDIIVSNPPYIPNQDMRTLSEDVINYEDYGALCGGQDGMDVIRDIVKRLPEWCQHTSVTSHNHNNNDNSAICWMEVDTSHPKLMSEWLKSGHNDYVEFVDGIKDFYGLDRFVKLKVKKTWYKKIMIE